MGSTMVDVPGYRVLATLGVGGFATVYRARTAAGAEVALKVAHPGPGALARLEREAAALTAIGPRHAPAVHAVGRFDRTPYLAMTYIADPPLARLVAAAPTPALGDALTRFAALTRAVDAAHRAGVIHRDLTPTNLLCGVDVRLIDLGLAGATTGAASETQGRTVVGTPAYMAPEQWRPGALHDERTDLYALGCLLYLVVTGAPPFTGHRAALQEAHLGARPEPLSRRRPDAAALDELATRCLAKAPGDRIGSTAAVLEALASLDGASAAPRTIATAATALEPLAFVLLTTDDAPTAIEARVASRGARVAAARAGRCALVVDRSTLEQAVIDAVALARVLVEDGVVRGAGVEIFDAMVRARHGGAPRVTANRLADAAAYPAPDDPPGVWLGPRAAAHSAGDATGPDGRRWLGPAEAPTPAPVGLHGREGELAGLLDDAARAFVDGPAIATVFADTGVGKTRLAAELVTRLSARPDVAVLALSGDAPGDAVLRALVAFAFELPDQARTAPPHLEPLTQAAVAVAMGWRRPDAPDVASLAIAPGALRSALARQVGLALRARAAVTPIAIVVDDLDRVDVACQDALELAALDSGGARLWVCGLASPALTAGRPAWGHRARRHARSTLAPLDDAAADALLRQALAPVTAVPAGALALLRQRAAGVPLLLLELAAALRRAGALRRHSKGAGWYLAQDEVDRLPAIASIGELAARELGALSPALAAHAELVALLGDEVEVEVEEVQAVLTRLEAAGVAGMAQLDARVGLTRLVAAGLMVAHGPDRYRFRHALVRDAIARTIPGARRMAIHSAAADRMAAHDDGDDRERGARLAAHLAGAGRHAEAARRTAALGDEAAARHDYALAERYYGAALAALDGETATRARVLQRRGVVRTRLGRYGDARADLDAALACPGADTVSVLLDLAMTLDWCDEWRASAELAERAAALAGPAPPLAIAARLALAQGRSRHRFSRDAEAVPLLERAVTMADRLGPDGYETAVVGLVLLGYILPSLGRLDDAEAVFARVLPMCEQAGDRWHLAAAHNNRVTLWTARHDRDALVADLEQVRVIGHELGYDRMEWFAHFNLAEALFWLGETDAALVHAASAEAIDRHSLGEHGRPRAQLLRARILAWRDDRAAARAACAELTAHQRAAAADGRTDALLMPGEQVQHAATTLHSESAAAAAWDEVLARAHEHLSGQELIEVLESRARSAQRDGDLAAERAAIAAALAIDTPSLSRRRLEARRAELDHAT
jgi:tetratricopeptide (TPR) repeat protein